MDNPVGGGDPLARRPEIVRFFVASAGYLEGDLDTVGDELVAWRTELGYEPEVRRLTGDLPTVLRALNPLLDTARPRELLVRAGSWVAYFDCLSRDTDADSTCPVLSRRLGTRAVKVGAAPNGHEFRGMTSAPGVQFHLWGPEGDEPLRYVRTIDAVEENGRWVFTETGRTQDFEEPENYRERRVRNRFTVDMVRRYCRALGFDVFAVDTYGPEALLVSSNVVVPAGTREVWL